jgi:hypothetical protein
MYPHERSLVKRLEGKPFVLLGVNSDAKRDELKKALDKEKITWRSWFDGGKTGGPIASRWNVQGWPTLYVLDQRGVIHRKYLGSPEKINTMDGLIDRLVKDAQGSAPAKSAAGDRGQPKH